MTGHTDPEGGIFSLLQAIHYYVFKILITTFAS